MNAFVGNVGNQKTVTENGMSARQSTNSKLVDLFYMIGSSRGRNIIPEFTNAFNEDKELALRIALWARDIREGSGERQTFRDILKYLEKNHKEDCISILHMIPELGRWDDLLIFDEDDVNQEALAIYEYGLNVLENGLAAKWAPRKGKNAYKLRSFMNLTPKKYRKLIVSLTDVVETKMSDKKWNEIEFGKVPSLAASRYRNAFTKNAPEEFQKYVEGLSKGTEKVNTGAVYPYDVLKSALKQKSSYGLYNSYNKMSADEISFINAQWDALPNFVGDKKILPVIDISGSMTCPATNALSCMDIAISLGLYCASKNTGDFADTFMTFSKSPRLVKLKGNITDRIPQVFEGMGYNTNFEKTVEKIVDHAIDFNVPQEDMPDKVIFFSDMQFDHARGYRNNISANNLWKDKFVSAGYVVPEIVYWNLNSSYKNVPVSFHENGTYLVSGFSPNIMKTLLSSDAKTPYDVMLDVIMNDRYNFKG